MAGANSIIRVIAAIISVVVIIFVAAVGVALYEPIAQQMDLPASVGWETPNFLFFMGLGLIGLVIVVVVWLIVAPIRRDVRQEQRRRI